jgi:uncharacterized protein (TIGR03790 family)
MGVFMRHGIVFAFVIGLTPTARALEPADVWLVVNKNVPESRQVADHYIAKRGVPKGNVITLDLPAGENISRADYDARLAGPLRDALKDHKDRARVLLTTFGGWRRCARNWPPPARSSPNWRRTRKPTRRSWTPPGPR